MRKMRVLKLFFVISPSEARNITKTIAVVMNLTGKAIACSMLLSRT
jgi:hypothetical protein